MKEEKPRGWVSGLPQTVGTQYPAPFLKKSPLLVGLHLLSLCCGQDVIVVFSVFSQNNMGAYIFQEITVGHFRSHCHPLAQTFIAHPRAVTSHLHTFLPLTRPV